MKNIQYGNTVAQETAIHKPNNRKNIFPCFLIFKGDIIYRRGEYHKSHSNTTYSYNKDMELATSPTWNMSKKKIKLGKMVKIIPLNNNTLKRLKVIYSIERISNSIHYILVSPRIFHKLMIEAQYRQCILLVQIVHITLILSSYILYL